MTLRARLIVAFLALALIPTGAFTVFTLDQLNRAIGRWYRPGVDRALGSALEVTKSSLARLETMVSVQASEWAGRWPTIEAGHDDRSLRSALRSSGIDFIQIYRRDHGQWNRTRQIVAEGMIMAQRPELGTEIDGALLSNHVIQSSTGALAGAASIAPDEVLVAGIGVQPDFFAQLGTVTSGTTYYRQLGVYVELQRRFIWLLVAGVALGLVALALFLGTGLAREMSRPLKELAGAIGQVAAGDLSTRVTPRGALELRSLGSSFNTMASRLETARDALREAEREALWRDVARKLAHEFKNLLTPMQLSLQLLECQLDSMAEAEREPARQNLRAVLREVENLNRLSEQFSQYARLPEPHFEPVDLSEIVQMAVGLEPPGRIRVAAPVGVARVRGDRLLLSRAVHNLIVNACEASTAGQPIDVSTAVEGGGGLIEILDRGSGLPAELHQRLFEPYVSTKRRGSGLGLSLVRDIARQHGGRVTIEDREGGGVRARLTLPLWQGGSHEAPAA